MSSCPVNANAMMAVARRQLGSLLGNPLGYVFIFAFVLAIGATLFLFMGDSFFARNIADLGPLHNIMPWFLAILLPALAMGTWASERDSGTEELLLTMPLSIFDAILGKYLAVAAYFSIALLCSFSNVIVLAWLGTPDWGLVISNFAGWWLAGLAFGALGLLASVLVSLPAIAFVIGMIFSGIALWAAQGADWFDAFNRGVVPLGHLGAVLAVIIAALGTAMFMLASRRWRPQGRAAALGQVLSLVFGLLLLANLARLAQRTGVDADITSEGLASLSTNGATVLKDVVEPVTITAFISADLPPDLAVKGKEVVDKLKAVERAKPGQISVTILRPKDALDKAGATASREFNLKPRKQQVDTVAGKEPTDVFLGAAVSSGGKTQLIEYFDPGLSVEYELVRAVRAVGAPKKPVLGIASTDLDINGGFDYQSGQMSQPWEIVTEWKKQYDVREVNLDAAVVADVEVLVVPQPSSLTQAQIEHLHDYVWAGRPALLLEDPLPFFSMMSGRSDLIPGQPKKSANPNGQPQDPSGGPAKGNLQPLWRALGLDFDSSTILWSEFNPSHEFRGAIPPNFVWTFKDQGGVKDTAATTGITGLLMPFPGQILVAKDKPAAIEVTPLFSPIPNASWGRDSISELTQQGYGMMGQGGGLQLKEPKTRFSGEPRNPSAMAVEVKGTMAAAYPVADPNAKPVDAKADAKDTKPAEPEKKTGIPSAKPVHVIVIADVDFANNEFFAFYRNADKRFNQDALQFLLNLRNVQLAANSVDALFNDQAYLSMRTSRPQRRPLKKLEDQLVSTQEVVRKATQAADGEADSKGAEANKAFQDQLAKIDAREDIDENAKAHEKAMVQIREQRRLDVQLNDVNLTKEGKLREAKIEQRRAIDGYRDQVRWLAVGVPAAVMGLLVLIVFLRKVAAEQAHVPGNRKRHA